MNLALQTYNQYSSMFGDETLIKLEVRTSTIRLAMLYKILNNLIDISDNLTNNEDKYHKKT